MLAILPEKDRDATTAAARPLKLFEACPPHETNGSVLGYKHFDFGPAPARSAYPRTVALKIELRDHGVPAVLEVWLGEPKNGRRLGAFSIKPTKPPGHSYAPSEGWRTLSIPIEAPSGRHALHLRFAVEPHAPKDEEIADVRAFGFSEFSARNAH